MILAARAEEMIDVAGFTKLDEKTVWQAIYNTGIKNSDWTIRKETDNDMPVIRLYMESAEDISAGECEERIHRELGKISKEYAALEETRGIRPLKVHLIPTGGFQLYYDTTKEEGVDLAYLKPNHMNPPDSVINKLIELSGTLA